MGDVLYVFRYFRVVPPIPALMTGAFAVVTAVGAVMVMLDPRQSGAALVPVLVLQAFAASAGFAAPARRGYFDLLLARGVSRVRIALVQWTTAILPGLVCWFALTVVAAFRQDGSPLLAAGTVVAVLIVSTTPWAVTVALPRFSGAIGWLLLVAVGSVMSAVPWPDGIRLVVYPVALVGQTLAGRGDVVAPAVALPVAAMGAALAWVHSADIPLESAQ